MTDLPVRPGMAQGESWLPSFRLFWLMLGIFSFSSIRYADCLCSPNESRALLALKGENQFEALSSWKEGSDCCRGWVGVTCDTIATRVVALNLTVRSQPYLQPSNVNISRNICGLYELQVLNVSIGSGNGDGDIPFCLWNMTKLTYLSISTPMATAIGHSGGSYIGRQGGISVQGSLPAQVCNLRQLTHLDIGGVSFENATIPNCFWTVTQLEHLTLTLGPMSTFSQVCNLTGLTHLDVVADFLTEVEIPSCIWKMTRLEFLSLISFRKPCLVSADVCNLKGLTHLDLTDSTLDGDIPSCIWDLISLEHVGWQASLSSPSASLSADICTLKNLSYLAIEFVATPQSYVPACLWNLTRLEVLELLPSYGSLHLRLPGSFFAQLCNLSSLRRLALPYPGITGVLPACIWKMPHLELLDLTGLDLSTMEYPSVVFAPSLTELYLDATNIGAAFLDAIGNLTSLSQLQISQNGLMSLPHGIQNLSLLESLDASSNMITKVPAAWISKFSSLRWLDLSENNITDVALPADKTSLAGFGNSSLLVDLTDNSFSDIEAVLTIPRLTDLRLQGNRITRIPKSVFNSSKLSFLDLSDNPLQDISGLCHLPPGLYGLELNNCSLGNLGFAPSCFKGLIQLSLLIISGNNISGDLSALISSSIHNLTNLFLLDLSNNIISGELSSFLEPTPNLGVLDVSRNQLTGELPRSLLSRSSDILAGRGGLASVNVSGNHLRGRLPEPHGQNWIIDVSRNNLEGELPSFSMSTCQDLVLSKNKFTGGIPLGLRRSVGTLYRLDLSYNNLSGEIPAHFGKFTDLGILDLTSNNFNGSIPEALGDCKYLQHLRLKNNALVGQIPISIGTIGNSLQSLTISNNSIEGSIPSTLGKCVGLTLLDLSHNNLNGTLPSTLENLSASLRVFSVASNRLSGRFPAWIIGHNFTSLQVMDLSNNSFYGELPADYTKLSGFVNGTNSNNNDTLYDDSVAITVNGLSLEVTYFVTVRTSFDVSSNHLSGRIPERLGDLHSLRYLTLSSNNFSGDIPTELSNLRQLESLDLSKNSLSGSIPLQLAAIPQLAYFDVSYNFLNGPIPKGGQFNTFNESSFQNNSALCNFPLPPCGGNARPTSDGVGMSWMAVDGFLVGFGTAFGGVGLTLLLSAKARRRLYTPRRKVRTVYTYSVPYGAYTPKS